MNKCKHVPAFERNFLGEFDNYKSLWFFKKVFIQIDVDKMRMEICWEIQAIWKGLS